VRAGLNAEQPMNSTHLQAVRSGAFGALALATLIFLSAGTLRYWQGWVYAFVFVAACTAFTIYLALYDPELLQRRMRAGPSQEQEPAQKVIVWFLMLGFFLLIILPAFDHRFGWSQTPWYVSIAGDILVLLAFFFFYRVVRVNSFAASTIQVERDQQVVSTGPYAWMRHPMYSGAIVLLVGTPLALGSWWGLVVVPLFLLVLVFRILNEEEVLVRELPGYPAYQQQVRYRLIPFLW
jgi:protein-S-isoprenylcysteine O-methyltransferase Ste14